VTSLPPQVKIGTVTDFNAGHLASRSAMARSRHGQRGCWPRYPACPDRQVPWRAAPGSKTSRWNTTAASVTWAARPRAGVITGTTRGELAVLRPSRGRTGSWWRGAPPGISTSAGNHPRLSPSQSASARRRVAGT